MDAKTPPKPEVTDTTHMYMGKERSKIGGVRISGAQHRKFAARLLSLELELDKARAALAELPDVPEPVAVPSTWSRVLTVGLTALVPAFGLGVPDAPVTGALGWFGAAAMLAMVDLGAMSALRAEQGLVRKAPTLLTVALGGLGAAGLGGVAGALCAATLFAPARIAAGALSFGVAVGWLLWIYHKVRACTYERARIESEHGRLERQIERSTEAIDRAEGRSQPLYHDLADAASEALGVFDCETH